MKIIKFKIPGHILVADENGDEAAVETLAEVSMPYSEENLALAQSEAYGEVMVEDDGTGSGITQEAVIAAMSEACAAAITGGVDVVLSDGETYHFSLTLEDQMNLMSLQALLDAGAETVPYHADGQDCRYYGAEDFHTITQAATTWKMFQESYFNSLRGYIQSLESEEELEAVQYGMEIPEAFQTDVLRQLMGGMET